MMLDPEVARDMGVPEEFVGGNLFTFITNLWKAAHDKSTS
jgi:hypothetical protein